ncbi:unnamed protein product [Soboliphyme baturini]|uniref:T6PP_N domain-containing protein n=1 Tax=Soboliphyme baturini TaxID=241478 RepID=A0A183IBV9_9BILA|nr:unnamed protein product [Soboliphyme baturini]
MAGKHCLYEQSRRAVTCNLLKQLSIDSEDIDRIVKAKHDIERGMASGFSQSLIMDDGNPINFNIKDELVGIEKDIFFLENIKHGLDTDKFIDYLSSFHQVSKAQFHAELSQLEAMLQRMLRTGSIDLFITDWDGTMKTYCCNYRTSMQPAYSAVIVALFAERLTKLDMDALTFGGSWGREWLVDGRFVVFKDNFQQNGETMLKQLTDALTALMRGSPEFSRFFLIGSGFQRKVDRVTIGVQNVNGDIANETVARFLNALNDELRELDPDRTHFCVHNDKLDVEIILKGRENNPWNKADGVRFLLSEVRQATPRGSVWICGDTMSDLPMVDFALSLTDRAYATFINPSDELTAQIRSRLQPDRLCIAGCPEVLHAALLKSVIHEKELANLVANVQPSNTATAATAIIDAGRPAE